MAGGSAGCASAADPGCGEVERLIATIDVRFLAILLPTLRRTPQRSGNDPQRPLAIRERWRYRAGRQTKIAKIKEFCYETAHNPSTVNWKLRCLHDDGSERRRLLRLRCVSARLRRTSCLCRSTSGRRCSTSCRCRSSSCCRRSTPKGLLTIGYRVGIRRASSQRRILAARKHVWQEHTLVPPSAHCQGE
jgi:hypothetical protein